MKHLSLFFIFFSLLFFTACEGPSLGGNVKKTYFPNGTLQEEFIMSDATGKNGKLKKYGYDGHITSVVTIHNGVKDGVEIMYDQEGRVIRETPYVNGKKHGVRKDLFPNGDVLATTPYQNDMRNGTAYVYYKDGRVYRKVIFKNDKMIN
jgi:antitoxin component YwqK of YwqJK toxin-antitoxin module